MGKGKQLAVTPYVVTFSCNLQFFSELITTQLRDFHMVSPQVAFPCPSTSPKVKFKPTTVILVFCIVSVLVKGALVRSHEINSCRVVRDHDDREVVTVLTTRSGSRGITQKGCGFLCIKALNHPKGM